MSDAVRREITQALQEGHGMDKGVAIAGRCLFFDFESCEVIKLRRFDLYDNIVRLLSLHNNMA